MRRLLKKYWLHLAALTVIAVYIAGCSWGQIQTKNYYILSYTPSSTPPPQSRRPYDYSLQIARFEVQRIFNRQNILYRFSPHQIQYYELEQWAVRPDAMITDVVSKHILDSGLVNRVGTEFYTTRPDFRLEGMVEAIEKLDAGDLFYAHLAMSFKMVNGETGTQVWEYAFDQRRQVYQPEMVYTVRGLTSILQSQMDVVATQLDSLFLTMSGGVPASAPKVKKDAVSAPADSLASDGVDESAFEIIRENQGSREEK